ncbi:MAG TPA: hypothetical protein DCR11_07740 [Deltaproteobacteria bacterium]|nr:hypothetical protein [Deltaproteobacteria bacterium]
MRTSGGRIRRAGKRPQRAEMKGTDNILKYDMTSFAERLDLAGLFIMAVALPLSEGAKNIGFAVAVLGFLLSFRRKRGLIITAFGFGLLALFLSGALSTITALDQRASVKGLWDVFRYGMVFLVAANSVITEGEGRAVIWGLLASLAIGGLWGAAVMQSAGKPLEILSLGHSNHTGIFVSMAAAVSLCLFLFGRGRSERALFAFATAFFMIILLFTASRGAFLAFMAAAIAILAFRYSCSKVKAAALLAVLVICTIGYFYSPLNVKSGAYDSERFKIWRISMRSFEAHPLSGIGLNNFYLSGSEMTLSHAHNLYVNTLVQNGVIGAAALAAVLAGAATLLWKARGLRCADPLYGRTVWYGALGVYVIVIVAGLTNTTLHHEHAIFFTLAMGLLAAASRTRRSD